MCRLRNAVHGSADVAGGRWLSVRHGGIRRHPGRPAPVSNILRRGQDVIKVLQTSSSRPPDVTPVDCRLESLG